MDRVSLDEISAASVTQRAEWQVQQRTMRDDGQTCAGTVRQAKFDRFDEQIVQFAPGRMPSRRERDRIAAARSDVRRGATAFILTDERGRRSDELLQLCASDVDLCALNGAVGCNRPDIQ